MATGRKRAADTNQNANSDNNSELSAEAGDEQFQLDEESAETLRQQFSQAIEPMIENLRKQISEAVQQQDESATEDSSESEGGALASLGSLGTTIQSAIDKVVELIQRLVNWLEEKFGSLGEKVAEAIGEVAGQVVKRAIRSAF